MANLFLVTAAIFCVFGFAWLALAMDTHWKQVRNGKPSARAVRVLRYLGSTALFISLLLCLAVDHPSMASLVWIMLLAASALMVAFTFTWHPRLFLPLISWVKTVK